MSSDTKTENPPAFNLGECGLGPHHRVDFNGDLWERRISDPNGDAILAFGEDYPSDAEYWVRVPKHLADAMLAARKESTDA